MSEKGYTYIMANRKNGTLYIWMTSNIKRRVSEHKRKQSKLGFTTTYNLTHLVRFCEYNTIEEAKAYEKKLKAGNRKRKIDLIESINEDRKDLSDVR